MVNTWSCKAAGRIGTVELYLDGDDKMAAVLEEVVSIEGDDTRLIRLSHIGENHVHHP